MVRGTPARAGVKDGAGSECVEKPGPHRYRDRRVTGPSQKCWPSWQPRGQARQEAQRADRPRQRAVGAGARHRLVFIDGLLATLVHLRHEVTHDVLACFGR